MEHQRKQIIAASLGLASRLVASMIREFRVSLRNQSRSLHLSALQNPVSHQKFQQILGVAKNFTVKWCNVDPLTGDFSRKSGSGPKRKLSDDARSLVLSETHKRGRSSQKVATILENVLGVKVHSSTIMREWHRAGFRPFKMFRVPLETAAHRLQRVALCQFLHEWTENTCKMRLFVSDEFFVWWTRSPNSQNHRIWARQRSEVAHLLRSPQATHPQCISFFCAFPRAVLSSSLNRMDRTGVVITSENTS